MTKDVAEQVADLIHESFKYAHGSLRDTTGIVGASQPGGDVRRELMYCAAQLKRHDLSDDILSKVDANMRLARAMGFFSDETYDKIMKLLEKVQ